MTDKIKKTASEVQVARLSCVGVGTDHVRFLKAFCFLTTDEFRDSGYMLHMDGITLCGKATKEKKKTLQRLHVATNGGCTEVVCMHPQSPK